MSKQHFDFNAVRSDIADCAFEAYNFGDEHGVTVESADGWESDGSPDVTRIVYINGNEGEDTIRVSFHVRFVSEGSNDIEDVYGLVMSNGGEIGSFPLTMDAFNASMLAAQAN